MTKNASGSTKSRIVAAAWKLFYENGYEHTTIDDIVSLSATSKGSFYHYFASKDDLLGSLAYLFDEKYEELAKDFDPNASAYETLLYLNRELSSMVEERIEISLLTRLLSTQLTVQGNKQLLDHTRFYFKFLRRIIVAGQAKGELTDSMTANEIVRLYAMTERALLYDWCLREGSYSLSEYGARVLPMFLKSLLK